jgi:hypothetical protein
MAGLEGCLGEKCFKKRYNYQYSYSLRETRIPALANAFAIISYIKLNMPKKSFE